jgi:hypothetical protein
LSWFLHGIPRGKSAGIPNIWLRPLRSDIGDSDIRLSPNSLPISDRVPLFRN